MNQSKWHLSYSELTQKRYKGKKIKVFNGRLIGLMEVLIYGKGKTCQMRSYIKEALLSMLGNDDITVIKSVATCVASIASIEIPLNMWADVHSYTFPKCQ